MMIKFSCLFLVSLLVTGGKASPEIRIVNVEPEEFIPDTQIVNEELYLLTNVTRLELSCEAHFPVQWDFSGDTSPMQVEVRALRKSGPKLNKSTFTVRLIVYRVSSHITGTYHCRSVLNHEKGTKVHIFAQEKGYRGPDPVLIKYGQTLNLIVGDRDESVRIPCASWNPKIPIYLYKKSKATGQYEIAQPKDAYTYDAKSGFNLNLTQVDGAWGEYLCSPAIEKTFDRVYVNLLRKPDYRVEPSSEIIEIEEGKDLHLTCEGKDEVSLYVNGDKVESGEKAYRSNSEYPYVVNLTCKNLGPDAATEINCVSKEGDKKVHTWKYRVVSEFDKRRRGIVRFYSRRTKMDWFACWARTSVSPDLSFVHCSNPMECQIRGQCLKNGNKCDSALVELCSGGCAKASIQNQTGILQCKGDGVFQQVQQFVGASGNYVYNSMTEAPEQEQLVLRGEDVFKVGDVGQFTCQGSTFLYAGGFRWGIKYEGQKNLKILEPTSEEVVGLEETFLPSGQVVAIAELRLTSVKLSQINCFAPFWNGTEWDSRKHPVYIRE